MITDFKMLIETCKQELHDREYGGQHAAIIITEWDAVAQWFQQKGFTEFNTESGYQYCDEVIGSHIIVEGMTPRQKLRLRACRMLISYQKNGDFEFRSPRVERIFSGETGNMMTQFIQHERAIGRSEKTIESREMFLYAFNLYMQRFDLSFNDLSVDCIETFFKSMNYELAMRHNSANHLRQLFHYLYDHGITATDNALFVLKDQYRNQNKLPTTYTEKEISKTLAAVDRSSAIGKRDYLIIPYWKEKRHGAHAFRHSLASNLLKKNISMPVISTVLGHQRTETTRIYLKVDMEKLALCPLPVPGLRSPHYREVKSV